MKRCLVLVTFIVLALHVAPAYAQQKATAQNVPEITYTSVPNFLKLPPGEYLGESVAVATNSKGHIFVYHRSANTRLFEFDQNGNFVKEIGKGYYGFEFAHSVRVDAQDNIWTVDEGTNTVTKFSPQGKVLMVLGRRPPAVDGAVATTNGPNPPAQKYIFCRPTDVGWAFVYCRALLTLWWLDVAINPVKIPGFWPPRCHHRRSGASIGAP